MKAKKQKKSTDQDKLSHTLVVFQRKCINLFDDYFVTHFIYAKKKNPSLACDKMFTESIANEQITLCNNLSWSAHDETYETFWFFQNALQ